MNRMILTAAAALIAAPVLAAEHSGGDMAADEQMTMLQQRLGEALAECDVQMDEDAMMELTMAQVAGIVLASNSGGGSDTCERVAAVARGDM